jgi:hypothetical protein
MMLRSPLYDRPALGAPAITSVTPDNVALSSLVPAGIALTGPTPAEEATR